MDLTFPEFGCNDQTTQPSTAREFDKEATAASPLAQEDHWGAPSKQTGKS
jgi:hypothetical protein